MTDKEKKLLINKAIEARKFSYCPYSDYQVGAALLTESGKIYTGCNIENAAFTPGICAERTAVYKAVSEGERKFTAISIAGGPKNEAVTDYSYPCGVCRQVMEEFVNPEDFLILVGKTEEDIKEFTLKELLPFGFGPSNLE